MRIKKIVFLLATVAFIFSLFVFTGCDTVTNVVENYLIGNIVLKEGESYAFDVEDIFKDAGIEITEYELNDKTGRLSIDGNSISAVKSGITNLGITLYEDATRTQYRVTLAKVYSIIESDLTPIYTGDQLLAISETKKGNYILKSDIELYGVDWEPIGNSTLGYGFQGMFVNLSGYKINNLSVSSTQRIFNNNGCTVGLFSSIEDSFIYGVELSNLNIDVSGFENEYPFSRAGGIAGISLNSTVVNCKVSGNIKTSYRTGGIIGSVNWGLLSDCEFNGISETLDVDGAQAGAGGIAGYCGGGNITNCFVIGTVISGRYAGGIVGFFEAYDAYITNCFFDGVLSAPIYDEIIGYENC